MLIANTLAYLHLLGVIGLFACLSMEIVLCRTEWLNGAALRKLAAIDLAYGASAALVLATGLARIHGLGKGPDWYWANGLLHAKLGLFVGVALLSLLPTRRFLRWRRQWLRQQRLPAAAEINATRRLVMVEVHVLAIIPLLAVLLARGWGG